MVIVDANAIIRVILNDNEAMVSETIALIKAKPVMIKNEVMAEIVYVLMKVYKISRADVYKCISDLVKIKNIQTESRAVTEHALNTFCNKNLDFVDCLLYAYYSVNGDEVFTFDKAINKLIGQ